MVCFNFLLLSEAETCCPAAAWGISPLPSFGSSPIWRLTQTTACGSSLWGSNESASPYFVDLTFREAKCEDALDWVKEHEDRRERRHGIIMVATIAAAVGAWLAALILLLGRL
jgi:hypothetical protein